MLEAFVSKSILYVSWNTRWNQRKTTPKIIQNVPQIFFNYIYIFKWPPVMCFHPTDISYTYYNVVVPTNLIASYHLGWTQQYVIHPEDYVANYELSFELSMGSFDDIDNEDLTCNDVHNDLHWHATMKLEINSFKIN
jgi:hypothetical protein